MNMKNELITLNALLDSFDKHSAYTNAKIERGIEENRKGLFNICIKDAEGRSIDCERVHINQVSHEFKFGTPLFVLDQLETPERNEKYKELFKNIFNYAVLPLYHKDMETKPGEYRFDKDSEFIWRRPPIDKVTDFCRENNIRMKAHCLAYNSFNPDWYKDASYRDINISIDEYMAAISQRYKKDILDMDVINEMFTIYKNGYVGYGARDLPVTDERDHTSKMFLWAKKYFPYTRLFWNEGVFETFGNGNYKGQRSTYYMMLQEHINRGVPIEGVGIQYHLYATVGTTDGSLNEYCALSNPLRLFDALDCYGEFNLPIHISEISVPSYSNDSECEALQGELTKRIISLFFSHRNIESMVWWNFCDKMAHKSESRLHTGILRNDLSRKPAYDALDELINHKWHTELDACQRAEGNIEFVGFYGDYEVSFVYEGREYKKVITLNRENTGFDNRLIAPREIGITVDGADEV